MCVEALEAAAASFVVWRPEIEDAICDIEMEVNNIVKHWDHAAIDTLSHHLSLMVPPVFAIARSLDGSLADGSNGLCYKTPGNNGFGLTSSPTCCPSQCYTPNDTPRRKSLHPFGSDSKFNFPKLDGETEAMVLPLLKVL